MTIAEIAVTLLFRLYKWPTWKALTLIGLLASACYAQTFNYSGSLSSPNQVFELSFTLTAPTNVTIATTSWAAGNFDPVMWLFDASLNQVAKNDDACNGQGCSPIDRDSLIQITALAAGTYTAVVSAYDQHFWRAGAAGNPAGVLVSGWSYNGGFAGLPPNYAVVFTTSLPIATPVAQTLFPPSDIGPDAPVLISPASGTTGVSLTPTLSWNAVSGTNGYTVYAGTTNPPITSLGQTSGTSFTPTVSLTWGTTYYWRIASRDPNNNNTENPSLVWTFTTAATPPPPAAPTLVSPLNGGPGLPWLPTLSWNSVSGTNGYNVYLGTTNPPTASTLTTNLSYTPPASLTPGVTYYWYVASRDPNNNNAQSASAIWSFTTSSLLPSPALLSPANGATGLSPSTSLSWTAVSGSNGYTVYLGTTDPPTSSTLSTGTSFTPSTPLAQGSTYYWRVSSRDANNGNFESPSPVWSFSVASALPGPTLSSPANGATKVATTPSLSWNAVSGSAGYNVYLGTTNPPATSASTTGTSYTPSAPLSAGLTYYWMVASIDPNNNNKKTTSAVWSFTTVAPAPAAPTLSSPANGAAGIAVNSSLSWNPVTGTAGYSVYLGTTNPPTVSTQVSGTTYTPSTALSPGTLYYWMVASRDPNNNNKETDSALWSFKTASPVIPAPTLASPANGAAGVSISTTLSWNAVSGTAGYNVYLGTANPPQTATFTNAASFTPAVLISGTKYYWYVTSIDPNNNNKQAASPVWSFTTTAFPSATLSSPPNNATAVPVSTSLTWTAVPNAGGYTVYLGTSNPPTTTYVSFTNSFTPYAPLNPGTKYYWYISSHDPQNLLIGSPSSVWSFTTASGFPAPGPTSPANGATGVPVSPTFTWNSVAGSAGYNVYLGTTNPPTVGVGVSGTSFTPTTSLNGGTTYYWYVASRDPKNGNKEAPSSVWSFVTAKAFPTPTQNSPQNGATGTPLTISLSWTSVPQSAGYNVYLGTTNPPTTSTYSAANSLRPTLNGNTTYYWYVASRDPSNNDRESSTPVWSFTTVYVMPPPGQTSPSNGATVPVTASLNWSAVNGSNGYTLYLGTSNPPTVSTVVSGTSFNPNAPLNSGTTYYWYVASRDPNNNNKETPSPVWPFTTSVPLAAPALVSPANQSTGVPTEPNLTWSPVTGSAGYTVYLDTANPPAMSTQTAGSQFTPATALVPGTQYYWMVSSRDPNYNFQEAKSAVWSFTTAPASPYSGRRTITINHAQVPNSDQANFPFLFNTTDPLLRTTINGGHVANTNAFDVIFTSDSAGTQKLDHEIEYYNGATGQFIAWVRIPALSHLTDTVIYMFYGNSAIVASQENKTGVWDVNYSAVYHMADNAANTNVTDSTTKHPATNQAATNTRSMPGQVDGALMFNGTSDFAAAADAPDLQSGNVQTVSFWMIPTDLSGAETNRIITDYTDANNYWAIVEETAGNTDFNTIRADMKVAGVDLHLKIPNNSLTPNVLYYVTAVFANSVPSVIYLNGTSLPLLTPNQGQLGYGTVPRFTIGASNNNAHPFPGILDEVRISTIVRSPDWIAAEYNNQANPGSFYSLSAESNAAQLAQLTTAILDADQGASLVNEAASGGEIVMLDGTGFINSGPSH